MAKEKPDLVYGTLDMLILKALQHDPRHGLAIADRIQQMSKEILHVEQGSLYPALYRLEAQGWIKAEWGVSDNNRRARYYELTAAGRELFQFIQPFFENVENMATRLRSGVSQHVRLGASEIVLREHPGRSGQDELTLYKSVGVAVEDAVAAALVLKAARESGAGLEIELEEL